VQNEVWHCPAEITTELFGKDVALMAVNVSAKCQNTPQHQWYSHPQKCPLMLPNIITDAGS